MANQELIGRNEDVDGEASPGVNNRLPPHEMHSIDPRKADSKSCRKFNDDAGRDSDPVS